MSHRFNDDILKLYDLFHDSSSNSFESCKQIDEEINF